MQSYHVAVSHSMGPRLKGSSGHSSLTQPRRLQSAPRPQRLRQQLVVNAQQGRRRPSAATTRASSVNETVTFGPQKDALLTTDSIDDFGVFNFAEEINYLQEVVDRLSAAPSIEEKVRERQPFLTSSAQAVPRVASRSTSLRVTPLCIHCR